MLDYGQVTNENVYVHKYWDNYAEAMVCFLSGRIRLKQVMVVFSIELFRPASVLSSHKQGWDIAHLCQAPCGSAEQVCVGSKNTGQDWQVTIALLESLHPFSS